MDLYVLDKVVYLLRTPAMHQLMFGLRPAPVPEVNSVLPQIRIRPLFVHCWSLLRAAMTVLHFALQLLGLERYLSRHIVLLW